MSDCNFVSCKPKYTDFDWLRENDDYVPLEWKCYCTIDSDSMCLECKPKPKYYDYYDDYGDGECKLKSFFKDTQGIHFKCFVISVRGNHTITSKPRDSIYIVNVIEGYTIRKDLNSAIIDPKNIVSTYSLYYPIEYEKIHDIKKSLSITEKELYSNGYILPFKGVSSKESYSLEFGKLVEEYKSISLTVTDISEKKTNPHVKRRMRHKT